MGEVVRRYLREWALLSFGVTLFIMSLPLYESWESRAVLQRWSYTYAAVLVCMLLLWTVFLFITWRAARRRRQGSAVPRLLFSCAIFFWGLAYFLSALESGTSAGRVFSLNIFGSVMPVAALLDWLAMLFLALAGGVFCARRLPQRAQNAAVVVGSVLSVALVGEALARVVAVTRPTVAGFPTYSAEIWERKHVTMNSYGYRDAEHQKPKPEHVRRVLVLGDSFAFGTGIRDVNDRFGEQLAERLSVLTRRQWEAINGGRQDTHTLQHLEALSELLQLNVDLVVLLYVFNDIDYLVPITDRTSGVHARGLLGRFNPVRVLFLNSYLYQEIFVRWRKLAPSGRSEWPGNAAYADDDVLQKHLHDLERLVAIGRQAGVPVRIVPFDNLIGLGAENRIRYERFVSKGRSFGLYICSLEFAFEGYAVEPLVVNSLDGHPNALANRLAAEGALHCLADGL